MSLWELGAAFTGWLAVNAPDAGPPTPSNEEHDAMVAKWAHVGGPVNGS